MRFVRAPPFSLVIVPGVSAGRPAGRRVRAIVVRRVRWARTIVRAYAPTFRPASRVACAALWKRDRRQNIVRVGALVLIARRGGVWRGRAGTFTLNKLECSKQAR